MKLELYESIKGYIKKYKSFKVGYFPSPIPDLDIKLKHSNEFPELMEMLVSFWWDEFASKCGYSEGWYEFQLKSDGDFLVLSNSFENNSWDEEGAFAFVEQLIDYGFYKYLNKFFTKKYIDSLIENEGFPEDVRAEKHMEDYISSLMDLKMEYNTKLGFKKFDFYFDDCKVHPSSRHFFFIRKLMKKTLNQLTNNGSYPADINTCDENKLDITFYNDFSFEINRPV